jgi:Uma2 family endonuclease
MATTIQTAPVPEVEYPDSDGMPIADNTLQFKWIVLFKEAFDAAFRHDPDVFVAGDLLWYPVQGDPKIRMAPDTLIAFGRPKGYRGSYKQWLEGGIAPRVVFEVLSPGNRPGAMGLKLEFYEKYGVEEYYIYDPDDGDLIGFHRVGAKPEEIPRMAGYTSPRPGIRFEPGEGPDNLTIIGPDGERFLTFQELMDQRDAERRRTAEAERQIAEAERQIAEAERRRAEAERRRAELLAAKLRELGVEPE